MDQWSHNTYGNITKPPELDEYGDNPPAYRSIGRIVSSNFGKEYRRKKKVEEKPNNIIAQLLEIEHDDDNLDKIQKICYDGG